MTSKTKKRKAPDKTLSTHVTQIRERSVKRTFKAECFVIGIDNFFLATDGNWTEEPQFAKKCGKANVLDGVVRDLKLAHTDRNVRLLRCKQSFTIVEVE